ncbi:MAG: glycerol-3-phosphate 1-O-acyltransferase PlsY [Gemmatimonadota bacterium]|nr:glycerol-3-phosphate 1-O-acyltransferase PlsY [Gemmatimonadota bacterium]MDH4348657.1 glycerol-3-phosphate 1-O-acyltransferase PlsY [Gemmatimonadota bacterium]
MIEAISWLLAAYLLGSIPASYLAGRWFAGVDLREHGSRNLGATNLYRTLGWKFAIPVGLFDVAKGAIPTLLVASRADGLPLLPSLCGLAAVVGHTLSPFVGFRGGKGVATAAGMLLALTPAAVGVVGLLWLVLVRLTGYVSLGSVAAAAAFPLADWALQPGRRNPADLGLDCLLAGFIIWKHRENISRLLAGTENRFGHRRQPPSAAASP